MSAALGPYPEMAGRGPAASAGPVAALQATRLVVLLTLLPASAVAAVGAAGSFGDLSAGAAFAAPVLVAAYWLVLLSPWAPVVLTSRSERRAESVLVSAVTAGLLLGGDGAAALVLLTLHLGVAQTLTRLTP